MRPTLLERFKAKVEKNEETGCWIWSGSRLTAGYGQFQHTKGKLAHRFAYEHWKGEIPKGYQIDHLCRVTSCVNPEHLEAVTVQENQRRGIGNAGKTHCPKGHPYAGGNLYQAPNNGGRYCRICKRETWRRFVAENPERAKAITERSRRQNRERIRLASAATFAKGQAERALTGETIKQYWDRKRKAKQDNKL